MAAEKQATVTVAENVETTPTRQDPSTDAPIASAAGAGASSTASAAHNRPEAPRVPRQDMVEKETVYVGNLYFDVTEEDLKKQFEQFGPILRAKVITDNRGLSKGYANVAHSRPDNVSNPSSNS